MMRRSTCMLAPVPSVEGFASASMSSRGANIPQVNDAHNVIHSTTDYSKSEMDQESDLVLSSMQPRSLSLSVSQNMQGSKFDELLAYSKCVQESIFADDNDIVSSLNEAQESAKGNNESIGHIEAIPSSHPDIVCSTENEANIAAAGNVMMNRQVSSRSAQGCANPVAKRPQRNPGKKSKHQLQSRKKKHANVDDAASRKRALAMKRKATHVCRMKSVLIEVSRGEFVQVHCRERAKWAMLKKRAQLVQCFVCLERYQVDRSAEALYCSNCESITRLGKGLAKRDLRVTDDDISPEELYQHDRRIAEEIRNHGGFEEAIHQTKRQSEQLREESLRIN